MLWINIKAHFIDQYDRKGRIFSDVRLLTSGILRIPFGKCVKFLWVIISKHFLLKILEKMWEDFPFVGIFRKQGSSSSRIIISWLVSDVCFCNFHRNIEHLLTHRNLHIDDKVSFLMCSRIWIMLESVHLAHCLERLAWSKKSICGRDYYSSQIYVCANWNL